VVLIYPTAKLAAKLGAQPAYFDFKSSTKLGGWYASSFKVGHTQLILGVCETSRLGVVIAAAPYASFPERLVAELAIVLTALGASPAAVAGELQSMGTLLLAKHHNRSVLGTINEYIFQIEACHDLNRSALKNLTSVSLMLSEIPRATLGILPDRETLRLLSV
jgi:hypothetical protein